MSEVKQKPRVKLEVEDSDDDVPIGQKLNKAKPKPRPQQVVDDSDDDVPLKAKLIKTPKTPKENRTPSDSRLKLSKVKPEQADCDDDDDKPLRPKLAKTPKDNDTLAKVRKDVRKDSSSPTVARKETDLKSAKKESDGAPKSAKKERDCTPKPVKKEAESSRVKKEETSSAIKSAKKEELASPANRKPNVSDSTKKKSGKDESEKKEKKVYSLPGQKHDPPDERDPLRIFYESLYKQNPDSEMAQIWMMEHGLLDAEAAKKALERKKKNQLTQKQVTPGKQSKDVNVKTPKSEKVSTEKKSSTNGDKSASKIKRIRGDTVPQDSDNDDDFIVKPGKKTKPT